MHRILFDENILGFHITLSSYAFLVLIAIISGVYLCLHFSLKSGHSKRDCWICIITYFIVLPIGSRLGDWLNNPDYYSLNGGSILVPKAGLILYIGLILALLSCYIVCRVLAIDYWSIMDTMTPGLALGVAIGAVGCFFNGCCFGTPTNVPWSVVFPPDSPPFWYYTQHLTNSLKDITICSLDPLSIHPAQLYESIAALIGLIVSLVLLKNNSKKGVPFLSFLIIYYTLRAFNWYWRAVTTTNPLMLELWPWIMPSVVIILMILLIWRISAKTQEDQL